jgi:tape measure domain-containing protein
MATEDVVIRYRAEVDDLIRQLQKIESAQEDVIDLQNQQTKEVNKATTSAEVASKKRLQLLELERQKLVELQKAKKLAFDPVEIDKYNRKIQESQNRISLLTNKASGFSSVVSNIGVGIAAAFSVGAIVNFTRAAIDAFSKIESSQLVFRNLVGDAEEANRIFNELREFSVRTPFTPEQVNSAAKALLQFGIANEDVIETVKLLGDVSAGTGKDLTELAVIFGQIRSTGRLTGQDLLQLINAGFNPLQEISERTGRAVIELRKEMEKGNITFDQVAESFKAATSEGGKFFNLTDKLADTTAGQLSTLQGEVDELAASIGQRLAPAYLSAYKAGLTFLKGLTDIFTLTQDQIQIDQVQERYKDQFDILKAQVEGAYQFLVDQGVKADDARIKSIEQTEKRIKELLFGIPGQSFPRFAPGSDQELRLRRELEWLEKINKQLLAKQKVEQKIDETQKVVSKQSEEDQDKRIAGIDKEIIKAERLTASYKDLFSAFSEGDQDALLDILISSEDFEDLKIKLAKFSVENKLEIPVELVLPEDRKVKEQADKLNGSLIDSYLKRFSEEIEVSQQLLGELTNLYANFADRAIEDINREKEARIKAIDDALLANEEALEKRRIGERQAADNEKKLRAERIKAEEDAAKKEREIKRRQLIADKAAALVRIAIQTAENVTRAAGNPALIALYAALGAAQAAIVLSQPIPYKKGTKSAKGGLSRVGEEGEEIMYVPKGAKVLPHGKTNRYGEVLDSMFDGRFDEFVNRKYIAPALVKERKRQAESFAINVARSAQINPDTGVPALSYYDMEQIRRKGTRLTDDTIDRLADAITRRASNDIYRR